MNEKTSQAAVVGRREEALCFLAAGFAVYEAGSLDEAAAAIDKAEQDGCPVIFVTSEFASVIEKTESVYGEKITPALLPLPTGESGPNSFGVRRMKSYVERAVGADVIYREGN